MPISVSPDIVKLFHFKNVLCKIKSLKPFIQKLIVDSRYVCLCINLILINYFCTDVCLNLTSFVECCSTGNLRLYNLLSTGSGLEHRLMLIVQKNAIDKQLRHTINQPCFNTSQFIIWQYCWVSCDVIYFSGGGGGGGVGQL